MMEGKVMPCKSCVIQDPEEFMRGIKASLIMLEGPSIVIYWDDVFFGDVKEVCRIELTKRQLKKWGNALMREWERMKEE